MIKKVFALAGLLFLCLGAWSQTVSKAHSGSSVKSVHVKRPAASPFAMAMQRGSVVYRKECLTCHQADGGGVPNLNPPLIKTSYVLGSKNRLIQILLKGMDQEIEIGGDYFNNPMPPHNYLSNRQIADVLTYVRNSFGNKAGSVSEEEVKKLRGNAK